MLNAGTKFWRGRAGAMQPFHKATQTNGLAKMSSVFPLATADDHFGPFSLNLKKKLSQQNT
jgi:hypothetical protein